MRVAAVSSLGFGFWIALVAGAAFSASAEQALPSVDAHLPWTVELRDDDPETGYVVSKRMPPGSPYAAYRLEAELNAPPETVARAARAGMADPDEHQASMRKEIVSDDGDVLIVYSYIDMPPFISDRDVITRSELRVDSATRTHRFEWRATDEGPAPRDGVIRLQKLEGAWIFEPLPGGRTRVTYESHTELGGSLPAWLLNSMMNDTVVQSYEGLRARVEDELRRGG